MTSRYIFIDVLRGVCVFYIVGFWHLMNYTSLFPGYANIVTLRLTVTVLGLFVFLSGYLLNTRGIDLGIKSIKKFYLKRFLRIYPLYMLAIIWFYLFHISDGVTLFKASLLISMFYGPPPPTLWFITMIMEFYLVAPLLITRSKQGSLFWIIAITIYCLMAYVTYFSSKSDPRVLIYFPAFVSGIYVATLNQYCSKRFFTIIAIGFVLSIILSMTVENFPERSYFSIPLTIFSPIVIFFLSAKYINFTQNIKLFSIISYAGFVMYLIHRPVYMVMSFLYKKLPIILDAEMQFVLYFYLICLPLITIASWIIQRIYDNALVNFRKI